MNHTRVQQKRRSSAQNSTVHGDGGDEGDTNLCQAMVAF